MNVVIVGAGVAGLGIGWRLQQRGVQVTLVERASPARAATFAAAGMIAVVGETWSAGTPEAIFAYQSSLLWPGFAMELKDVTGLDVDYRQNGALLIARSGGEFAGLEAHQNVSRLSPAQAREKEPMLAGKFEFALYAPNEAQVDNRLLAKALLRAFLGAGGVVAENEAVIAFEVEDSRVAAARTAFRRLRADRFLIAAGCWSAQFEGLPHNVLPSVRPVKGQMIALSSGSNDQLPTTVIRARDVYMVPRADRLLIGATVEAAAGFDTRVTDAASEFLLSRASSLLPGLDHFRLVERWAGLRPASPDDRPILGKTSLDNLFLATGQYRNGILMAPAIADSVARLMAQDTSTGLSAFDPRRFFGDNVV